MKRVMCAVGLLTALVSATPAMAQTAGAPAPAANAPAVNMWYVGGLVGAGAVQNVAAVAAIEGGVRVRHGIDIVFEGGYAQDVVSRRRLDFTTPVATYLTSTQGKTATADLKAPAMYGLGGVRWVMERDSAIRPYVIGQIGVASVEYKPTFTLGGTDVTATVSTYGVTVGNDIAGKSSKLAIGGGVGAWYVKGQWYADAGVRLTSIATDGQATNLVRAHVGFGVRF